MAIKPVKAISIIGLMSELDKVIKLCGDSCMFHPDDATEFFSDTQQFSPIAEKNPYTAPLQAMREMADKAGIELNYVKLKNFSVTSNALIKYEQFVTSKFDNFLNAKLKLTAELDSEKRKIEQVKPFIGTGINFDQISECQYIKATFGRIPLESYTKLTDYSDDPYILFFPCSQNETHCWGTYFSPKDRQEYVDRIFSALYFEKLEIPDFTSTPEELKKHLEQHIEELQKDLDNIQRKIEIFWEAEKDKCMMYYSKLEELSTYHEIKQYVYKYHKNFILVGWIPAEQEDFFTRQLDGIKSIEYSLSDGKDEIKHSPPIILKNPPFFKTYQYFVDMYGLPCYNEIDPTAIVALTYTLFFGIMFGDVGHGILLSLVGGLFMWKYKKMEIGRILVPCGISSAIFGFLYGSVFGFEHLLDPIHERLFHTDGKLFEVMEPESINMIIYSSVALGFVTLAVVMIVNIFSSFKRHDIENALFSPNGVAGFVFYVSLVAGVVCQMFLNIPLMNIWYIIFLIALPLLLIYLKEPLGRLVGGKKNWQPQKWGEYLVQSFFELFESLLGYVTNTMSFLRVGAYILVHAGMMLVVFTLAEMVGGIGSAVVLVIGNGLVMVLEALLVAIQVLRLDYYELFSRFYIGEGRAFSPIIANKKH